MTTPERQARRRRRTRSVIASYVVVVGAVLIWQPIHFRGQDEKQRACLASNFGDLATALNARGELARKDTKVNLIEAAATRLESGANNDFYKAAFASTDSAGFLQAYGDYRVKIAVVNRMRSKVDRRRVHIAEQREAHPIPAFPKGTCS